MLELFINNKIVQLIDYNNTVSSIKSTIFEKFGFHQEEYYLVFNGKKCSEDLIFNDGRVHLVWRLCGGKGGFGSMLRAIGAQIEKTTNREACRDLSGRRLRDINEEKRLKTWLTQQGEREKEKAEKKKKKLEKLCQEPKFEFKDDNYDKERSELTEKVEDAVVKGLQVAGTSGIRGKRKAKDAGPKKKKPKLWLDDDLDDELSSDISDNDTKKIVIKIEENSGTSADSENNTLDNKQNEENIKIEQSE